MPATHQHVVMPAATAQLQVGKFKAAREENEKRMQAVSERFYAAEGAEARKNLAEELEVCALLTAWRKHTA